MKKYFLLLIVLLKGCKEEKIFEDNITLNFPKDERLIFQEFNDDLTHRGTSLIYIGEIRPHIDIKYYKYIIPPVKIYGNEVQNLKTRKKV